MATQATMAVGGGRKRKFSPMRMLVPGSPEAYWVCGKKGHIKDECLFIRCRFYKVLGHRVGEYTIAPVRKEVQVHKHNTLGR